MRRYDTRWQQDDYVYFKNGMIHLKENAPKELKKSYEHYKQQKREEFSKKKIK